MDVIPVLDLRGGCAVHADGGDRSRYPVVEGVLGSGTDPVGLATRFRDRLGCATVYVADLDAIAGLGHSHDVIAGIAATRSEERRVGKECRGRGSRGAYEKKG